MVTQAHVDLAAICGFIGGMSSEGPSQVQWLLLQKMAANTLNDLRNPELLISGSEYEPVK